MEEELPLPQEESSAGCRGDQSSPEDRGIWERGFSSKAQGTAKGKQDPEFDVKVAATGGSDRTASTAICADSVPAKSHASHRNHLN